MTFTAKWIEFNPGADFSLRVWILHLNECIVCLNGSVFVIVIPVACVIADPFQLFHSNINMRNHIYCFIFCFQVSGFRVLVSCFYHIHTSRVVCPQLNMTETVSEIHWRQMNTSLSHQYFTMFSNRSGIIWH